MSNNTKNLANLIELWTKFDIEATKKELDDKVIEIAQQLDEGDQSRKRLIEQTKDFRKNLNDEQRKLVAPLLKSFQIEVDSSSKRSKLMEQVLLKLYKQLIELPDPIGAIENAQRLQKKSERVQDLEIENKQLRDTLDEYNVEFAQVKNQEVTIKSLKDKIRELEERVEQQVAQKSKEKEKELQRSYADKEELFQNAQLELVKRLGDAEARQLHLQSELSKAHAQLYEFKSKQDEILNGKACEIDLLMLDLDKMTERAMNAERLSEQYADQLSALKDNNNANNQTNNSLGQISSRDGMDLGYNQAKAFEIDLLAKEKEITQLVEDIKKLQIKANKSREFYESQRVQLEEKLVSRERTLEQLEAELRKKQDYDEIRKELSILKTIEFNLPMPGGDDNDDGDDDDETKMRTNEMGAPSHAGGASDQVTQKPLEVLFMEKNRHLQNENISLKAKLTELQLKCDEACKERLALQTSSLEQKNLIAVLEKDLLRLAKSQNVAGQANLDSTSPAILAEFDTDPMRVTAEFERSAGLDGESQLSLFNIVSNQRERFRQRIQELESESVGNKQQCLFLTNEIDRLRSDNIKLYEKIKFLQSAGAGTNKHKGPPRYDESGGAGDLSPTNDDVNLVLNRYTNEYERKLDPFSKFGVEERQRRYAGLQLHDKFTLRLGRFILSSKMARLVFCAYFFVIHLLIFGSLYHMAHHDAMYRDFSAECAMSYKEHMSKEHGINTFDLPHSH